MKQQEIPYSKIKELEFDEELCKDDVYFNHYGFDYVITTKKLTKKIYVEWVKETRTCRLVRFDSPKKGNIMAEIPILDIPHLESVIDFFLDKKNKQNENKIH